MAAGVRRQAEPRGEAADAGKGDGDGGRSSAVEPPSVTRIRAGSPEHPHGWDAKRGARDDSNVNHASGDQRPLDIASA